MKQAGNRQRFLCLALALSAIPAMDATIAAPTATSGPLQPYEYESDRIYIVRTALGITTQIELSPHEKVLDYSTGFSSGWDITRRDNVFYVKPRNVDVDTNLVIRTETHTYVLELRVVASDWKTLEEARRAGVQYKVSFTYPSDTSFKEETKAVNEVPELDTRLVKGRTYNFDYAFAKRRKSAPWLVPASVYDDGRFTYIKLPDLTHLPTGTFPAVYMREKAHGGDSLVNSTVEGNVIVVHGTYDYLVLRHGNDVVGLRRNKKK